MYVYENVNPQKKLVKDCVIRAIANVIGKTWHEVYFDICAEGGVECDMPSSNGIWKNYLMRNGFKMELIPNTCPNCYTIKDFTKDHPNGSYIVCTGEHAVAVKGGNYYDTWDSGDEIPLYYFYKGE